MRILHTADWHIGHQLNGWSREDEHRSFFDSLTEIIADEQIDVLIVSGDVFDNLNPSGESQRIFYEAIAGFRRARPTLKTVITSGNHDPAGRLEAPSALLDLHDVRIVGVMRRDGAVNDLASHLIWLPEADRPRGVLLAAIPFLRAADLPGLTFASQSQAEGRSPVTAAVAQLIGEIGELARKEAGDHPVIAMAHLTCLGAQENEMSERSILIGGQHALPVEVFHDHFDYVALGHLHMAQTLRGGRVRYSGSCFPLSVTEASYRHGVTIIDIGNDDRVIEPRHIQIAHPAEFLRFPERGQGTIEELSAWLQDQPMAADLPPGLRPFLYLRLVTDEAATHVQTEAQSMISALPVRLADLRIHRAAGAHTEPDPTRRRLEDMTPEDLFIREFTRVNLNPPSDHHVAAFRETLAGV